MPIRAAAANDQSCFHMPSSTKERKSDDEETRTGRREAASSRDKVFSLMQQPHPPCWRKCVSILCNEWMRYVRGPEKRQKKKKPDADIFCKHIFISAKVKQDFQKMNPEISAKGLHHITTNFTVNIIWGWCITSGTVHPKKNKRIMLLFIQLHVVSKPLFNDRRLWSSKKDKNTINAP